MFSTFDDHILQKIYSTTEKCIATHQGHVLMLYVLGMNGCIQNGSNRAPGSTNVSMSRYSVDM